MRPLFKRSELISLFSILITLTLLLYYSPPVSATDLSTSTINADDDMYALQKTVIAVLAEGTSGVVSGATVNISATLGTFIDSGKSWIELTTNSSGLVSTVFQAPDTENETSSFDVIITAHITSDSDSIQLQKNITIHPIDFTTSEVSFSPNMIYEDHNTTVTVIAKGPYGTIEGATVDFSCTDGQFANGQITYSANTDSNGVATVKWQAPLLAVETKEFNISATVSYVDKTVTFDLSKNITVYAIDFNSSTLVLSQNKVGGGDSITVSVNAIGQIGPVSYALISLSALDGTFTNGQTSIDGQANGDGIYSTTWTAPDVDADINITITATITYTNIPQIKQLSKDVLVYPVVHNFTNIQLQANATSVIVGDLVEITLTVTNELGNYVEGATATFTALEGAFIGGTNTIEVNTTADGKATVIWNTSTVNPPIGGIEYSITVSLIKEGYNTNSSSIEIFVAPPQYKLVTSTTVSATVITQGQNVTITVMVTANSQPVADASVQIVAQDGKFASSNDAIAIKNTNETGYVTFIWITEDMIVTTAKNYTFTIQASLPGYTTSDTETITIQVNPQSTGTTETTQTTKEGSDIYKNLGILLGAVAGVIVLGALGYLFLRRKPVV